MPTDRNGSRSSGLFPAVVMIIDCATDPLGWCGNVWIKISTRRYDHQDWVWGETLLLPNAELPWFKINGAVALDTDGVGANQNRIGQGSLQGEDLMITCSVDGA